MTIGLPYDIINISKKKGGQTMGKRKSKKPPIFDIIIKLTVAAAALIKAIAELIEAFN